MLARHHLRPYQSAIARAILDSVLRDRGLTFTVEVARRGGVRELSAQLELLLLSLHAHAGIRLAKVSPNPASSGMDRLLAHLKAGSMEGLWSREPQSVRLGRAQKLFVGPESLATLEGPIGLLEVAEAHRLQGEVHERRLRLLAEASGATTVLYGVPWNGVTWFELLKQENRRREGADGLRRHFRVPCPWEEVVRHYPLYGQYVAQERACLGEEHPSFQSGYMLRPMPATGALLSETQRRQLQGAHRRRRSPEPGKAYVATVAMHQGHRQRGTSEPIPSASALTSMVVTVSEMDASGGPTPYFRVADHRWWQGAGPAGMLPHLADLLRNHWRCRRVVVEAHSDNQELADLLYDALGHATLELHAPTPEGDAELVLGLLAAVGADRLKLYAADGSQEHRAARHEAGSAQVHYLPGATVSTEIYEPGAGLLRGLLLLTRTARRQPATAWASPSTPVHRAPPIAAAS